MTRLVLDSPIGPLAVETQADAVVGVHFGVPSAAVPSGAVPIDASVAVELAGYFAGRLTDFSVAVTIVRGSPFERAVWAELSRIPYGEVAAAVGDAAASRAVGTACNRNPVPLLVPCHRVVGAGGKLVGFGGGLDRKRHLLELEARVSLERAWR